MGNTITLKLPSGLATKLDLAVRTRGTTRSAVVREALEAHLSGTQTQTGSCLDLVRDLAGSVAGPEDLSSNPRYLRGYGR